MWLRWVASNIARSSARQKIVEAASKVFQSVAGGEKAASGKTTTQRRPQIAFVFALGVESGGLVDKLNGTVTTKGATFLEHSGHLEDRNVVVCEVGVGAEASSQGTADVIELLHPDWVVSAGFASSLDVDVHRGDILMANEVKDESGSRLQLQLNVPFQSIEETPSLHTGCLLSTAEMVHSPERRHELAKEFTAVGCDMETMAVAKACHDAGTRFLSIRLITEGVDDRLPPEVEALHQQQSVAGRIGAFTGALFNRLSSVKDVWKFKGEAMKASDRLARFLVDVAGQLGQPTRQAEKDIAEKDKTEKDKTEK